MMPVRITGKDGIDGSQSRRILFCIAFASFMVNLDTYIVNISLPTIAAAFHCDTSAVSWVSMAYQLTVTGFLLVFGRLGDRYSIKRVFLFGYGLFTLSSLLCGLSASLWTLVAARALQGIGASVLYALTPAMVPRFLPERMRGPAFGVLATVAALGVMAGNPLGGIITGYFSWPWIFYINLPVGMVAMIVCWLVIPDGESRPDDHRAIDFPAAVTSFICLFGLTFTLNRITHLGWQSPVIWSAMGITAASLVLFALRERVSGSPLLDYSMFRSRAFSAGNVANFLAYAYLAGNNFIIPFYLIMVKGLSPEQAGVTLLIYSAVFFCVGPVAGFLSNRVSPRLLCTCALVMGSGLSLSFSFFLGLPGILPAIIYFALLAVVFGVFLPSNNNVVMGMAPDGKQGIVSASFRMVGRVGMTFGVCLFEAIFSMMTPGGSRTVTKVLNQFAMEPVLDAFKWIYLAGGLILAVAAVFSWLSRERGK